MRRQRLQKQDDVLNKTANDFMNLTTNFENEAETPSFLKINPSLNQRLMNSTMQAGKENSKSPKKPHSTVRLRNGKKVLRS